MKTDDLIKALNLAKPSLGSADAVLPVLSHFCFMDDALYAYNDITAIIVSQETGLNCALHGDTLAGILDAAGADEIKIKTGTNGEAHLDVGGGWVKVPMLPESNFAFTFPDGVAGLKLKVTDEMCKAVSLCLMSVASNSLRPEFNGIMFVVTKGEVAFYSSDNVTASRYKGGQDKIIGRKEVACVLPAIACQHLLKLHEAVGGGDFAMDDKTVCVTYAPDNAPDVVLVSKLIAAQEQAAKFERIFELHAAAEKINIPPALVQELKKAAVLLGRDGVKNCTLVFEKEKLIVEANGILGIMKSELSYDNKKVSGKVVIDPDLVLRVLPHVETMTVNDRPDCHSLVFYGGAYTHIVSSKTSTAAS